MDTRTKIVSLAGGISAARTARSAGRRVKLVTGYFDPLVASHAEWLSSIAKNGTLLFVAVETPPWQPLLSAGARAELVAALGVVDYVVLPVGDASGGGLEDLEADEVVQEKAADECRTRDLIRHVHERQQRT